MRISSLRIQTYILWYRSSLQSSLDKAKFMTHSRCISRGQFSWSWGWILHALAKFPLFSVTLDCFIKRSTLSWLNCWISTPLEPIVVQDLFSDSQTHCKKPVKNFTWRKPPWSQKSTSSQCVILIVENLFLRGKSDCHIVNFLVLSTSFLHLYIGKKAEFVQRPIRASWGRNQNSRSSGNK